MRIAILSRNSKLYSTRRLVEACEARDHEVLVRNTLKCYMDITSHRPSVHYAGQEPEPFDAVISGRHQGPHQADGWCTAGGKATGGHSG